MGVTFGKVGVADWLMNLIDKYIMDAKMQSIIKKIKQARIGKEVFLEDGFYKS